MSRNPIDEIVSLFFTIGRRLRQQANNKTGSFSLNLQQLETLRHIAEHGRISMKEVAAFSCISPPSATTLVNQMVNLKVLKREYDQKNRRSIYLAVTKKGQSLLTQTLHDKSEEFSRIIKQLNKQEQLTMLHLLKKMTV